MSSVSLDKVMEEVRALTPDEQRQVREMIDELLKGSAASLEDLLDRDMLEAGLIRRIPLRSADSNYPEFKPIKVQGKPVSETIIEERR